MKQILLFFIVIISVTSTIAENPVNVELVTGENSVIIEEFFPSIYASQIIQEYPSITAITLKEYGLYSGYIQAFGGIGRNFLIEPGKEYLIHTKENVTVILKG